MIVTPDKLAFFRKHGYVVIDGVLPLFVCALALSACWDFVEAASGGKVDRSKPETHTSKNWIGGVHGLVQHFGIGQSKALWLVRLCPSVLQMFAELYAGMGLAPTSAADLVSTFDGMSFPRTGSQKHFDDSKWQHKDQALLDDEFNFMVQAGFNVGKSQDAEDHVFSCIPGSHACHKEYADANAELAQKQKGHFLKLTKEQLNWHRERGMALKRVPLPRGSGVLWDSRLVHASSRSLKGEPGQRAQVFVSLTPRCKMTPKQLKKRKQHFEEGRTTGHKGGVFPKRPRTYGRPTTDVAVAPYFTPANASDLVKRLVGF